ncbi:VanZ family protein [Metabacillus iocasae]|uniref:VanZ family protein n=1 Tax=Priestia iocasae TaxID=2291674 RepID=A0ABS2QSF7_9BACI|nr:VanZ family protein [Metabacillus iocasae]MBM7702381.1 VanZ family protein [Metabacillus iocasae]
MKRILLVFLLLSIAHFSHTPHLKVTDPSSWFNESNWDHDASVAEILAPDSEFYDAYEYKIDEEFVLRKLAHITFFGLLALLFLANVKQNRLRYVKAFVYTALFALSDELHQAFVIGRDGRMWDVLLDSVSGLVFLVGYFMMTRWRKRY